MSILNIEINELKSDIWLDKMKRDDVMENASLVYNNQLNFLDDYIQWWWYGG